MNEDSGATIAVVILLTFVAGFMVGFAAGRDWGHRQVFNGSYTCIKLPDNTTHCYRVEAKNQ